VTHETNYSIDNSACVQAGGRQVLSIGGFFGDFKDVDPAPQGLLLFDMTNMAWKDSYEAGLPTYERADAIQMLYSADALPDHKVQWSSDRVRALFATAPDCKSFLSLPPSARRQKRHQYSKTCC